MVNLDFLDDPAASPCYRVHVEHSADGIRVTCDRPGMIVSRWFFSNARPLTPGAQRVLDELLRLEKAQWL